VTAHIADPDKEVIRMDAITDVLIYAAAALMPFWGIALFAFLFFVLPGSLAFAVVELIDKIDDIRWAHKERKQKKGAK
jgi:hypothetical protein